MSICNQSIPSTDMAVTTTKIVVYSLSIVKLFSFSFNVSARLHKQQQKLTSSGAFCENLNNAKRISCMTEKQLSSFE